MEQLLVILVEKPMATIAGAIAMVCLATWPLFRKRSMMLTTYIGNNLGFVVHYALIGHWTAVATCCEQTSGTDLADRLPTSGTAIHTEWKKRLSLPQSVGLHRRSAARPPIGSIGSPKVERRGRDGFTSSH
jgi:hypothetical protein